MQWTRHFGDRDFWRVAMRLTLPITLQKLLISSFSMVDTIMIGRLGETALAAVGIAGQWSFLLSVVFFGLTSGLSVFAAQYWGSRDMDGLHRAYGFAMVCALIISALFMLMALGIPDVVVRLFNREEAVVNEAVSYLLIAAFSYPALALSQVAGTVLCSTEQVKLPMYVSMVSVGVNVALNALFMYGMGMGVRGAALGTLISSWISPAVLYAVALRRKLLLIAPLKRLTDWSLAFIRRYFVVSLPVLFNESMWALGTTCFNMIYGQLSVDFFAAVTVFRSIEGVAMVFFWGMCHACSVIVGKHVGAGDFAAARLDAHRFTVISPLISVGIGLLMILGRSVILWPFGVEGAVLEYARFILLAYGLETGLRNIPAITIVGIFRAGGDTRTGLYYDMLCLWGLALPATLAASLWLKLPLTAVYVVMLLSEDLVKVVLCLRRFRSGKWIRPVNV